MGRQLASLTAGTRTDDWPPNAGMPSEASNDPAHQPFHLLDPCVARHPLRPRFPGQRKLNGAEIATPGQERRTAYLPNIPGSTEASLGLFPVDAQLLLLKLEGTADSGSPPTVCGRVFTHL